MDRRRVVSLSLVASLASALASGQGLADAAAREKQRLKKREAEKTAPARVITNEELASKGTQAAWTAPDGSFEAAFPAAPETKQAPDGGTIYRVASGGVAFVVNVKDLSSNAVPTALDDYRAAALNTLNDASLVSDSAVSSGSTTGRELIVSFARSSGAGRGVMRSRAFVSGTRLFGVMVMAHLGHESDPEVLAFHESFHILK